MSDNSGDNMTEINFKLVTMECINPECKKIVNTSYNMKCEKCWRSNIGYEAGNKNNIQEFVNIKGNNQSCGWIDLVEVKGCILIMGEG